MVFTEPRDQRGLREETWSTVPMTKNSRTIDPTKIPKISKVCSSCTHLSHVHCASSKQPCWIFHLFFLPAEKKYITIWMIKLGIKHDRMWWCEELKPQTNSLLFSTSKNKVYSSIGFALGRWGLNPRNCSFCDQSFQQSHFTCTDAWDPELLKV